MPHLTLVSFDDQLARTDVVHEPLVCFVSEGAKRTIAGDRSWSTGRGQVFLNSIHMPVTGVFERTPYRSATLRLDGQSLTDLLLELDGPTPAEPISQLTAPMTQELTDAVTRWIRLLDTPADIPALAPRIEGEILYRLLGTPIGPALRQLTLTDSPLARVRTAAAWICAHYTERLTIDQIAAVAHMSAATLHRRFKEATGMSPLRFQKHLRLQEARRRLVAGNTTAALVAAAVGYVSATQFNREYRREYGLPPTQDAARLRGELAGFP